MHVPDKINVFISYSWDGEEHQKWVRNLADWVRSNSGNPIFDQTHLKIGDHIKTFMIKSIMDADIVLIILTPNYKQKADNLQGGAGYEYNIINDQLYSMILSNRKFIPILREGDLESSTTHLLRGIRCLDLREGPDYEKHLNELKERLFDIPVKKIISTYVKTSTLERAYKDIASIASEMKTSAWKYFKKLYITDNKSISKLKLSAILKEWEDEITDYHNSFQKSFSPVKMTKYERYLEDFRKNIFAKDLWTVKAALKTPDPDLARYKKDFNNADAQEIYDTVNGILTASHDYSKKEAPLIKYNNLQNVEGLKMDYLNNEGMFMNKIIGFGIRSEILHRYFPALFSIMTQRSLWAMYFLCESADEFITIEKKSREAQIRVSHNWQYPYDRFTFLMNALFNDLNTWFGQYDLSLKPEFRFGYVNMFLTAISDLHKKDIRMLHEWVDA